MELITIYLQSKGRFVARQFDASDITIAPITVNLNEEQREVYNLCAILVS